MDLKPNKKRLLQLDLSNFSQGQTILFCPDCPWQADCEMAMKPVCPDCGAGLHFARVSQELFHITPDDLSGNPPSIVIDGNNPNTTKLDGSSLKEFPASRYSGIKRRE